MRVMKSVTVGLCLAMWLTGCSTVREIDDLESTPPSGKTVVVDNEEMLAYTIAVEINAPKERVWEVLTDVEAFSAWNSTVISLDGELKLGGEIELVSTVDPERTFPLTVSTFEPGRRMVWEDGMPLGMFTGVRTFVLSEPRSGVTKVTMSEVLSGGMLGMIKGDLPNFSPSFEAFAQDLKTTSEKAK